MNNEDLMNSSPDNSAAALNLDDPAHVHSESVDFLEPKSKSPIDFLQTQTMKMYVVYFALIILNIANSLTTSSVNDNDTTTVLLSTIFLVINFMFSLILVTYKQKDDFQKQGWRWIMPSLFFYSGLSFIISDLNIFPIVYEYHIGRSYLPGMDALIVHFLIWPKIIETKRSAYITLSLLLCILAFSLNIFGTQDFGVSLFQALLLLLVIYYGTIDFPNITKIDRESDYLPDSMLSDKENEPLNKPTTGFESIFSAINGAILVLLEAYESSEQKSRDFINQTITNLRKAINTLTKTNIYSSSFDIVTKNMDEQDKIFISQTFFEKPAIKPHSLSSKGDFKEKLENTLGVSELLGILRQIGKEWNFNTMFVNDVSGNMPIQVVGLYMIKRYGFDEIFSVNDRTINNFCKELELKYHPNPYHNSCHAADVMCSFLYIIHNSPVIDEMTSLELFASIVATLAHDVGHPARANRFLINTRDEIAIQYNDMSVLEMMHTTILFQILIKHENNIFSNLSTEKWSAIRKMIIDLILATDMSKHFDLLQHFKAKFINSSSPIDFSNGDYRHEISMMAIKMADIGHAAKSIELHEKWCVRVLDEFFSQGELEKSLGLPVSMYCDKETTDIAKSQSGFIKNIALPLFATMNSIVNSKEIEDNCIEQLKKNIAYWNARRLVSRNQTVVVKHDEGWLKKQYEILTHKVDRYRRGSHPNKFLS